MRDRIAGKLIKWHDGKASKDNYSHVYILSYVHCVCWTLYATNNFAKLIAKYSNQNVASFADALWDRQAEQLP